MPGGEIHHKLWKGGFLFSLPASIYLIIKEPLAGFGFFIGYCFGDFIDPDWDLMGATNAEGRVVKIPIVGWLIYGISSVYGAIFRKHHRSFITHFPLVSTIIRIIFVFFWIPLLYYFKIFTYQKWQGLIYLWFWFGLSFADGLHWGADMLFSDIKKSKNKGW